MLWWKIADIGHIGRDCISFEKIKAHATKREREDMAAALFVGNGFADKFAKEGVDLNTWQPWHVQMYEAKYYDTISVLRFAAQVSVNMANGFVDTTRKEDQEADATSDRIEIVADEPEVPSAGLAIAQGTPFLTFDVFQGSVRPEVEAVIAPAVFKDLADPALDPLCAKIALAQENGHLIVRCPQYVFCKICGRYASKVWKTLLKPCTGQCKNQGALNRLWRGVDSHGISFSASPASSQSAPP